GHSVFGSDLTGCSSRALKAFFLNRKVQTSCKRTQGRIRPDGPIPASLAQVRPAAAKGKRGRTVSAATLTVFDVLEQSADALLSNPFGIIHGGGLRGGRYFETTKTIALRDVVFIPGVHVTGDVSEGGAATLRISGKAASQGHIRIARGLVTGVLGGRSVRGRIGSLSQPARAGLARVSQHLAR
ncbi:MAG: hypothetical protein QOH32_4887, partial [Bradyrhizobium sp.]|nr:hypothetical protein [Bradyrhizobium sp.]